MIAALQALLPSGYVVLDPNPSDEDVEYDILRGDTLVARVGCWYDGSVVVRRLRHGHLASGVRCDDTASAVLAVLAPVLADA